MNLTFAIVAGLLLTVQVLCSFNCNRDRTQCMNGSTCNQETGDCDCMAGYSGYDCSVNDTNIDQGACSGFCANGGTCHQGPSDSTPTCLCPVEFIGTNCSSPRYDLTCDTDSMTVEISPFVPSFAGSVFVVDHQGETTCTATDDGGLQTITVNNIDAACGNTTEDAVTGTQQRCFYIIYNNNTFTSRDQRLCALCGGSATVTKSTGNITITDLDNQIDERTIGDAVLETDVDMKLLKDGAEVSGTVVLGDDLELVVYLTDTGADRGFQAVRLEECEATNVKAVTDPQYNSGNLIENSCPSPDLSIVITDNPNRTMDNFNVSFSFSAFRFIYGDIVSISCIIKPCKQLSECQARECPAGEDPPTGVGRRKRQADTEEFENKVLTRSYKIGVPDTTDNDGQTGVTSTDVTKACYQTWEMTATVVALAIALFLVLLLCLILVVKTILHRRTKTVYRDDSSSASSTAAFPNLPKIVSDRC